MRNLSYRDAVKALVLFGLMGGFVLDAGEDIETRTIVTTEISDYTIFFEDERKVVKYTTDLRNRDGADLVVWAIPDENRIRDGGSVVVTTYFKNESTKELLIPDLEQWQVAIFDGGGMDLRSRDRATPKPVKIDSGEIIAKDIVLDEIRVSGDFLQLEVSWGAFDIIAQKIYLKRNGKNP